MSYYSSQLELNKYNSVSKGPLPLLVDTSTPWSFAIIRDINGDAHLGNEWNAILSVYLCSTWRMWGLLTGRGYFHKNQINQNCHEHWNVATHVTG